MKFRTKLILSYILIITVAIFFALLYINIFIGTQFSRIIIEGNEQGFLIFMTPQGRIFLHAVRTALIWSGIISVLIGTVLALVISNFVTTPLKKMEGFVAKISKGDYTARIKITNDDEIGHLQKSLNKMAEHLTEIENMRKSLVQNVSHDLRTPLTSLKGYIEMVTDPEFTDTEKRKAIKVIQSEVERMESMLEELSKLSEIDSKKYEMHCQKISVIEAVQNAVNLMKMDAASKGLYIKIEAKEPVFVNADEKRLREVLINLLNNAIKFTDKGGITIHIYSYKNNGIITVSDTGKGIKDDDIVKIFDRFFRGEKSRPKTSGGLGVGLTIAKELIEAMNGTISVKSEVNKGTEFTIKLPLAH